MAQKNGSLDPIAFIIAFLAFFAQLLADPLKFYNRLNTFLATDSTTGPAANKFKFIKVEHARKDSRVLHLQLARPPQNLLNGEFYQEYASVFENIKSYGDVRVVVVSSALDQYFVGGLDLHDAFATLGAIKGLDPARVAYYYRDLLIAFQRALNAPEKANVAVICAMHGICIGLAYDLSLGCDIRYVASDAILSMPEVNLGFAGDVGQLARGPKAVYNKSMFTELACTAEKISADQALRLGFCSRVVDGSRDQVVNAALETAYVIATKSPVAVASTKRLVLNARDNTVAASLDYTQIWNGAMLQAKDVDIASKSAKPVFEPLYSQAPQASH